MKKAKVISDLRALINDLENGHADIRLYKYKFDDYEVDYGVTDDNIEQITLHVKRIAWPVEG